MRHFIAARPVTTRSLGMREPPSAAGLVAPSGGVLLAAPRSLRAVAGAVDLAAVATAADHSLGATIRAKKQSSRRRVTVFGPANAKWTNATIARIMPLHACPARCGARRRGETAKLGSAPCLPSITSKLLSRHPPRVSPSQTQRARPPANGTHSSTKSSRKPPLRQSRSVGRYPSLKGSSRRLNADSRRRQQPTAGVQQACRASRRYLKKHMMSDALEKRLIEALKSVDAHGDVAPLMSTIR